jgi:exopolyphosphatase/guanosine-5'-triphosphate,3'-diphosphate pyrophosphatase
MGALRKIAAIDVGSSSIHALLARVEPSGRLAVVDRVKERVRLVAGAERTLDPRRAKAAIDALARIAAQLEREGYDEVLAAATSAVRDADDGPAFVARVAAATGLALRVLSASEEAELSYRASRDAVDLGDRRALFVDIGGGSIQLTIGDARELAFSASLPLGVIRTTERFLRSDPPSAGDVRRLDAHLREQLDPILARIRRRSCSVAIGTSGTIRALAGVIAHRRGDRRSKSTLRTSPLRLEELSSLVEELVTLGPRARAALPKLPAHRADTIVAGALVLERVLSGAGIASLVPSRAGLREGLIREHLEGAGSALADVRRQRALFAHGRAGQARSTY